MTHKDDQNSPNYFSVKINTQISCFQTKSLEHSAVSLRLHKIFHIVFPITTTPVAHCDATQTSAQRLKKNPVIMLFVSTKMSRTFSLSNAHCCIGDQLARVGAMTKCICVVHIITPRTINITGLQK